MATLEVLDGTRIGDSFVDGNGSEKLGMCEGRKVNDFAEIFDSEISYFHEYGGYK